MKQREIQQILASHATRDGDGVAILRIAGMQNADMDPVLMIDELRSDDRADFAGGFPPHPHRGMQTLTFMKRGGIVHEDSAGNRGEIRAGGVQWMSAGRGVIHSEMPTADSDGFHGFQLWFNLPAAQKMSAPRYRDIEVDALPVVSAPGFKACVISGRWQLGSSSSQPAPAEGALTELAPYASMIDLALEPCVEVELSTDTMESAVAYVYNGAIANQRGAVHKGQLAITGGGDAWHLTAGEEGASLLVIRGRPLGEPVAHYGPFVMNTQQEIEQALQDYRAGRFG